MLSPLEASGRAARIQELLVRLEDGKVEEVIVAMNPDVEGEATALYLMKLLDGHPRDAPGRGPPMGGDLEFADQATLARALSGRREL